MTTHDRVLIAGAGPVGMVAAANLVRQGVPVTVLEANAALSEESRASTFHPPTLDMLDQLGAARPLIAQGLIAPQFQYRNRQDGLIAQFDFGAIADVTAHPFRVQCEQSRLTRILLGQLQHERNFEIVFSSAVRDVAQSADGVAVSVERHGRNETEAARFLIGADGARSETRGALGIDFEGFTWPERFLVVSTPFDFHRVIKDLVQVNYVADPQRWHFLLQTPAAWRIMFPIGADESDELALSHEFAQSLMATLVPGIDRYEITHTTLYRVHQRVATSFRKGRAFLIGDAAHINNPLGGMGMNGGIHDAINLTDRLAAVWHGSKPASELDRFDKQRRLVTKEYVEKQSIQNKKNLESPGTAFRDRLREIVADAGKTREYLLATAMIASLRRAEELG
ncbi:MAG: FAD-dependent monooxygenase [Alphaproteobacteria bacterium]|nr:FAD-dependent monooxygenase [Alphaproteobacteria bacterium]